jgi:hypothetical protein
MLNQFFQEFLVTEERIGRLRGFEYLQKGKLFFRGHGRPFRIAGPNGLRIKTRMARRKHSRLEEKETRAMPWLLWYRRQY